MDRWRAEITLEGESGPAEEPQTIVNIVVANGSRAGGNIPVAPDADPGDGLLDVVWIRHSSPTELGVLAAKMAVGHHLDDDRVESARTRSVQIRSDLTGPKGSVGPHPRTEERQTMTSWLTTSLGAAAMVVVTALGIYASVLILTRIAGLRSFAKISGFDFAMTVAIGAVLASAIITPDPPLLQAATGLVAIYGLQVSVAILRQRSATVRGIVDNDPLLLMDGPQVLHDNLTEARITEADLRAKLREANVLTTEQVRAVVMETTGDISVLRGDPDGPELEPGLLEGVDRGSC